MGNMQNLHDKLWMALHRIGTQGCSAFIGRTENYHVTYTSLQH